MTVNSKEENSRDFCLSHVQEFGSGWPKRGASCIAKNLYLAVVQIKETVRSSAANGWSIIVKFIKVVSLMNEFCSLACITSEYLSRCDTRKITGLRWNSWTAFLVEVLGHKLESSQTRLFVKFSTLIFPFYEMRLTMTNILELSCFADFLKYFKNWVEYGFR